MKNIILTFLMGVFIHAGVFSQNPDDQLVGPKEDKGNLARLFDDKNNEKNEEADNEDFSLHLDVGFGFYLQSLVSEAEETNENSSKWDFEPGNFKIGYLHLNASITENLESGLSYNMHGNSITDVFVKYTPFSFFGLQVGRFKGAGNRGANETSAYDIDFLDFAYNAEQQNIDKGATDLRFYGIDVFGKYKWLEYSFFWHTNKKERTRYWSTVTNDKVQGNGGVYFRS